MFASRRPHRRLAVRRWWRTTAVLLAACATLLATTTLPAAAYSNGGSGGVNCIAGGCGVGHGAGKGSTPGRSSSAPRPGRPVRTVRTPAPAPAPSTYLNGGIGPCPGGTGKTCVVYNMNPVCVGVHAQRCSGSTFKPGCATYSSAVTGVTAVSCPVQAGPTAVPGVSWPLGFHQARGQVQVAYWAVTYAGQTTTYPGRGLNTGYTIRCVPGATQVTVSYWLSLPSGAVRNPPPGGYYWAQAPPALPAVGPYSTTVAAPSCTTANQSPPTGITMVPSPDNPSLENGKAVVADGQSHLYAFTPETANGVNVELSWDGGSAKITNYPPMVANQIGPPYPRYEVSPVTASTTFGPLFAPPNMLVHVALHAPSNQGDPYQLSLSGAYTATWSYWYLDVQAQAYATEQQIPLTADHPPVPYTYTCVVGTRRHKPHKGQPIFGTCSGLRAVPPITVIWEQPVGFKVDNAALSAAAVDPQSRQFAVSATTKIEGLFVRVYQQAPQY